ncbi:hypothetical protein PRUPE_2G011900 [Prunus persica]|uniref:Uncharacterized protein n=1 Tax=Prunus persica TaxID=3760 RepID=M5X6M0_PRUPE|nr:hypothetical protein PRUPE_2G011900 [Prunus persica]
MLAFDEFSRFLGGLQRPSHMQGRFTTQEAFSLFGEIIKSKIINDRETERSRGFGFVTFNHEKAIRDTIEGING